MGEDDGWPAGVGDPLSPMPHPEVLEHDQDRVGTLVLGPGEEGGHRRIVLDGRLLGLQPDAETGGSAADLRGEACPVALYVVRGARPA